MFSTKSGINGSYKLGENKYVISIVVPSKQSDNIKIVIEGIENNSNFIKEAGINPSSKVFLNNINSKQVRAIKKQAEKTTSKYVTKDDAQKMLDSIKNYVGEKIEKNEHFDWFTKILNNIDWKIVSNMLSSALNMTSATLTSL